jgi:hypothetical protein
MIDVLIAAQERRPFRIDDPGNVGPRIRIPNGRDRGQRVDDVAE